MNHRLLHSVGRLFRRWLGRGFDYRRAYRNVDLEHDHWSIVGPASQEEHESLGRAKRDALIHWGLTPHGRVLDVGCGTGQLTAALLDYLSPQGCYHGTDIALEAIAFCQARFQRANFFFHRNDMTRIPLDGLSFDVVYFGSVFTHLFPDEIRELLLDVKRLLAGGGMIVADAFIAAAVASYRGDRGMVVINEDLLHEQFTAVGLPYRAIDVWDWSPGVRRAVYRFSAALDIDPARS